MDSFLTLSNLFKQIQSFNQIIPAAYLKSATLNSYEVNWWAYKCWQWVVLWYQFFEISI